MKKAIVAAPYMMLLLSAHSLAQKINAEIISNIEKNQIPYIHLFNKGPLT